MDGKCKGNVAIIFQIYYKNRTINAGYFVWLYSVEINVNLVEIGFIEKPYRYLM